MNGSRSCSPNLHTKGFTLIELLVVIGIIALLAALVVGGIGIATTNMRRSRAEGERDGLVTAIDSYKKAKGFYPPDNTNDPICIQNPLFYELTGMILYPAQANSYQSVVSGEILKDSQVGSLFHGGGTAGFINTSNSVDNPSQNFYTGLKAGQRLLVPSSSGVSYTVLGAGIPGPYMLPQPNGSFNPWHYNSSHPTNNVDSYDLWMDVNYAGKTNRISNWSKDPKVISW